MFLPTLEIVIISSVKPSTVRLPNAISDVKESTAGVSAVPLIVVVYFVPVKLSLTGFPSFA